MNGPKFFYSFLSGVLFTGFLLLASISISETESLEDLYFNAQFSQIAARLENKKKLLSLEERLLLVECQARISQGRSAETEVRSLHEEFPESPEVLAAVGIVAFSRGRFEMARLFTGKALEIDPDEPKAILTKAFLALYYQDFSAAQNQYEELKKNPLWSESYFLYLAGLELYKASGQPEKLRSLYDKHAREQRRSNRDIYDNAKMNAKMYGRITGEGLFRVSGPGKIVIPWQQDPSHEENIVFPLNIEDTEFQLVLDTGNAVGWMVHSRDFFNLLNSHTGGRALTQIGLVSGMLYGLNLYNDRIPFGSSQILRLSGMYVPKPHPSFYDANLNPIFLRNRVVTLDYIENLLVLRSKERFEEELEAARTDNPGHFVHMPFYGYERPLVPLIAEDKYSILGLFETGAEDITIRQDLALEWGLPLSPSVRYLASGQVFRYAKTPLRIKAGEFQWIRKEADVWPLDRFYDRLTGLSPDIVIGPKAFKERYVLSFNPFKKEVILSDLSY